MRKWLPFCVMTLLAWGAMRACADTVDRSGAEKRFSRELAVIDYFKQYRNVPGRRLSQKLLKGTLKELKKRGLTFTLEAPTIFNMSDKSKRELYKRIYIPSGAHCFTKEMYLGMKDYIKNGGLLITNCDMVYIDADGDGDFNGEDGLSRLSETLVTGIKGRQAGKINQLKSIVECPLTNGIKKKAWLNIDDVFVRRSIIASNADVLVLCRDVDEGGTSKGAPKPFLCFRHEGYGACVYLAGRVCDKLFKNAVTSKLFDNLFDQRTLNWLCLQK